MTGIIIDRIEDGVATLEFPGRVMREVPVSDLPENAREGDCLTLAEDGALKYDGGETDRRRRENIDLFKSLMED